MADLRQSEMHELVAALRGSRKALLHVTDNDWFLMISKSERRTFAKGETILQHGKQTRALYFIVRGEASILSAQNWPIASVGPGEVIGEMAFLEDSKPSAHVVAHEAVELLAIPWDALRQLFEMYPHMASRFYHSLALSLSRRLRQQISD